MLAVRASTTAATSRSAWKCCTRTTLKEIAKAVPDHLLLTETDNPGALRWLKKNDDIGMPTAIKDVVHALANLRRLPSIALKRWSVRISRG
jgi:Tat protein secretion system quality control protein TatD with DNase activity